MGDCEGLWMECPVVVISEEGTKRSDLCVRVAAIVDYGVDSEASVVERDQPIPALVQGTVEAPGGLESVVSGFATVVHEDSPGHHRIGRAGEGSDECSGLGLVVGDRESYGGGDIEVGGHGRSRLPFEVASPPGAARDEALF